MHSTICYVSHHHTLNRDDMQLFSTSQSYTLNNLFGERLLSLTYLHLTLLANDVNINGSYATSFFPEKYTRVSCRVLTRVCNPCRLCICNKQFIFNGIFNVIVFEYDCKTPDGA